MRRTVAIVVAAVAGLAILTGCNNQPQRLDGAAVPAGAAQTTVPSVGASAAGAVPVKGSESPASGGSTGKTSDSVKGGGALLGPDGFGELKLGMSLQEAKATGLITGKSEIMGSNGCDFGWRLKSSRESGIWFEGDKGIIAIGGEPAGATPEGIKVGSSRADVKRAYPKYDQVSDPEPMDGRGLTPVRGNSKAQYRIMIEDDKVTSITLQSTEQGCYE